MPSANGQLYPGDEEDILFLRVVKEIPIKGSMMMIGDGQNVKPLIGRFGDEFFRRIPYTVERVIRRMKMEIRFQGFYFSKLLVRFFNQFSGTFLKKNQNDLILMRIYRIELAFP